MSVHFVTLSFCVFFFFFFFQAEDGIRDLTVTGVQTCALPILPTNAEGFTWHQIEMDLVAPEKQFTLFFDDVRLPGDAVVGSPDQGLLQVFEIGRASCRERV